MRCRQSEKSPHQYGHNFLSAVLVLSSQILTRVWLRETTNCKFRYVTSICNVSERDLHRHRIDISATVDS